MTQPTVSPRIGTVFIFFDLNDPTSYAKFLDIMLYHQQTGKWPLLPVAPPEPPTPPIVIPPVVVPPVVRKVQVRVGRSGWVKNSPDANASAVRLIRNADGPFAIISSIPGWEKIVFGWLPIDVLFYTT